MFEDIPSVITKIEEVLGIKKYPSRQSKTQFLIIRKMNVKIAELQFDWRNNFAKVIFIRIP